MPRGGKREKAGRKSTWTSGRKIEDTTVIRVPKEYAAQLLEIAHKLDAGIVLEFKTESKNLELGSVTKSEEEFLDLVTEPKVLVENTSDEARQLEFLQVEKQSTKRKELEPHTGVQLAKRLNTSSSSITQYRDGKLHQSLRDWSRKRDPDGIAWEYSQTAKKYIPIQ